MAGSLVVACKQALVDLLDGQAGLTGVQVSYGWPGEAAQKELIFCGRVRSEHGTAALRTGRRFRNESGSFLVVVHVKTAGGTPEEAEERALELGTAVEECVADNKTLGGVPGLNSAVIEDMEMTNGITDTGAVAVLEYSLRYQARLT